MDRPTTRVTENAKPSAFVMGEGAQIGQHLLADLSGIAVSDLQDEWKLSALIGEALDDAGFTILQKMTHKFQQGGQGVTGVFLLSESHAAFHTYPERQYMAVDIFSCGNCRPQQVLDAIVAALTPTNVAISVQARACDLNMP